MQDVKDKVQQEPNPVEPQGQNNPPQPVTVTVLLVGLLAGVTLVGTLNGQWQQWWLKWLALPGFILLTSWFVYDFLRDRGNKYARAVSLTCLAVASAIDVTCYRTLEQPKIAVKPWFT